MLPDGRDASTLVSSHLDVALGRLRHCIAAVRAWPQEQFDHLHSIPVLPLPLLPRQLDLARQRRARGRNKLFVLNKALNGIDLFYEIELPEVFFIGHSVGIVLAKARYGNRLVLYQNAPSARTTARRRRSATAW